MTISHKRKQEIVAIFQRSLRQDNSAEMETVTVDELRNVNAMLGQRDVNEGYRIAIQDRIKWLDVTEHRRHESNVRAWDYVMGIVTGLIIAGVAALIF